MNEQNLYANFYQMVINYPQKTALVHDKNEVTYTELEWMVEEIEHKLLERSVSPGNFVIVCMTNSVEAVAAMLAIHKVGAVVLPLDVSLPINRIQKIYKDCDVSLILCNEESKSLISDVNVLMIEFHKPIHQSIRVEESYSSYIVNETAFCIYTSGSNGIPKGVLLSHRGVCNQIQGKTQLLELSKDSILCLSLSIGFVACIWEIYSAVTLGATLVIYSNQIIKNPYELFAQADRDHVQVLSTLPQMLKSYLVLIENQHPKLKLQDMKYVMLTGEKLHAEIVEDFYQQYQIPIVNAYGQSECSDDTLCYKVPFEFTQIHVPIGEALLGVELYLVDEEGKMITISDEVDRYVGELCIGGKCLSLGYYKDQALTEEKFVYHHEAGKVLFHTGDLVERSKDGIFTFLGRLDNQVKIRGYRISLEEIESYVLQYPSIQKAAVAAVIEEGTVNEILCFYQCENEIPYDKISNALRNSLPTYAIPSRFIKLDTFLYTASGKIDRKRMARECMTSESFTHEVTTGDEVEQNVLQIVQNVMPATNVALDLNTTFQSMNMDSLLFLQIAIACEDAFHIMFDESMLLYAMYETVSDIVRYVRKKIEENTK